MYFVYILISKKDSRRYYIGFTDNLDERINKHNTGQTYYAGRYAPWELSSYIFFQKKERALEFERYLKSGSGFAFLKKHLL